MSSRIGVGFIGAGAIARLRHGPNLARIGGVDLVAVANRSQASGRSFADTFGIDTVHDDWRAVLADDRVDAVFISTWPYMHSQMSLAALEAGKHVFCQARLAMDAADARRMVSARDAAGLTTMVCPPPHGMQFADQIASIVGGGQLGQIRHLTVRDFSPAYLDPTTPLHWRQQETRSGTNTLTLGIVYEVLITWFALRAKWVQAGDAVFTAERPSEQGPGRVERPDAVFVTAGLENGALANLTLSAVAGGIPATEISAFGTEASLHWVGGPPNNEAGTLTLQRSPDWAGEPFAPDPASSWRVEAEFIDAVRSGRSGRPSWDTGLAYMQFVEAVEQSARTGRRVDLTTV